MANRYGLSRLLGGAIATIAILSIFSSVIVLAALRDLDTTTAARARSLEVIAQLDAFRTAMLNQETGERGYLVTGQQNSLEPYRIGRQNFDAAVAQLRTLLAGDADATAQVAEAEAAARAWQSTIGESVVRLMADPATRGQAMALEATEAGKDRFDSFRERLNAVQRAQEQILRAQDAAFARAERNASLALWAGSALILVICGAVGVAVQRLVTRPLTRMADVMRRIAQRELDIAVPDRHYQNEVGAMARAVEVFREGMIELDRTSLLRVTADTLPAMLGYVDADRKIGFLNGEFSRWFDLRVADVSELHGRLLAEVFRPNPFPGAARELEAAFAGAETRFEHRLARRGVARRDIEAVYRPHKAADGRVLGVVTLLTDITERKRMELRLAQQTRDLRRSNEELEQFAYVASHDLKAPLRGIENLVSWIEEDLEGQLTGDTRTNMDLLKSRVRRLESLLDDLLAYSRAGRGEVSYDTVDTAALVEELATLVSPPEGFSITGEPPLPTLHTARAPLTQVLQNLIGNAIKHHPSPATGHVRVAAVAVAGGHEFTVADDGAGIPPQFRERVFGMFQTLRPRDEVEGSGMGLAIVKKLVERGGGRIWLESAEPHGLVVHFTWMDAKKDAADDDDRQPAAGR